MKKILLTAVVFAMALVMAGTAQAYTITDAIGDQIGTSKFDLYGIDVAHTNGTVIFDIYTNYHQNGVSVGSWNTFAGDLFFDFSGDGTYDHGVVFTNNEGLTPGAFYEISTFKISNQYAPSGYLYNKDFPVAITSGNFIGMADSFLWEDIPGSQPNNRWQIVLDDSYFAHGVDLGLFYPVASCANDYIQGSFAVVPEPASLLLFGTGLAGFGVFKRKKFNL